MSNPEKIEKINLFGKTKVDLNSELSSYNFPSFTSTQIAEWMYIRKLTDFSEMTNIPEKIRKQLNDTYQILTSQPVDTATSSDGTKKYLFHITKNRFIETALIPEKDRSTLCISSQVGCKMGCSFCMTSKQGYQANLTSGEIINQLHSIPESSSVKNIVFMGMGEPMDNLDEVLKSIEIFIHYYNISYKKITVSTIGLLSQIKRYLEFSKSPLAISLHSPFNEERGKLMPIEKTNPVEEIIRFIRNLRIDKQQRISFEYILFDGLNDTPEHIKGLTKLLHGLKCRVNLIKYHSLPNSVLKSPQQEKMIWFRNSLTRKGLFTTIRKSRGQDIQAACGLLSTLKQAKKK